MFKIYGVNRQYVMIIICSFRSNTKILLCHIQFFFFNRQINLTLELIRTMNRSMNVSMVRFVGFCFSIVLTFFVRSLGICKVFEEHLKKRSPTSPSITYDISELFEFVDQISDLSCLVFQKQTGQYKLHNKDWIKQEIFQLLRKQASGGK